MQTACVIPPPLGFVCGSPSYPTTQYPSQSPLQQKSPQISSTPRNSRRRSARNSVQLFLSSVIQYATADQSISPSSPLNPPSPSRVVEFEKRDMASTTAQDCSHPQISLLSEMLRRQMIGGIGNCRDSRIGSRCIRFDCGSNRGRSDFTPNSDVSGRKCLKFGDCPSVVRQPQQVQQPRQPATILANTNTSTNETVTTHTPKYMTPIKTIDNDGTLISSGTGLTNVSTTFKKGKHLSPPPSKSLFLSKAVEASDEEEEEEEDEDGYLEDDEDDQEEDGEDDEEEEDDDGEELSLSPSNLNSSFNSTTRPNIKAHIHPTSIVSATTSSEQEQSTTTSSHSTAPSILTHVNRPIRKAKSLPYRVTSGDTASNDPSDWHHNEKKTPALVVRRRKLGVKSIPIPKILNSHHFYEPCHNNAHKRRHGHQKSKNEDALWIDIISARRVRMAGAVDKSKEDKEEDVLWPLSI